MSNTYLITADQLYAQIKDPELVIIDCSFDLADPGWGNQNYLNGHIPGAFYANLDQDLSSKITESSGRHPLPDEKDFINFCTKIGIYPSKKVVLYDTESGAYAGRLWWLLRSFGHHNTMLLNGGLNAWLESGLPLEKNPPQFLPQQFEGKFSSKLIVTTKEMETLVNNDKFTIIDARSPVRYSGVEEPIDRIAGHIPGAINIFHKENLLENGRFKSAKDLKKLYFPHIQYKKQENIIVYCGSGVTSCLDLLALAIIDITNARLYLGSWSEWIQNENHPIVSISEDK